MSDGAIVSDTGGGLVEFVGGPADGDRRQVDQLLGRLSFEEERPPDGRHKAPIEKLIAGERVLVSEWEHPDKIVHWYSRTEPARVRDHARVYTYVGFEGAL